MSTTFAAQVVDLDPSSGAAAVVSTIARLTGRRRWWQALIWVSGGLAFVFGALLLTGVLDHALGFSRPVRIGFLVVICGVLVVSLAVGGWRLFRRRSLVLGAEEIQRCGGRTDNALVTFISHGLGTSGLPAYLSARLEMQAVRALSAIDPVTVVQRRPARLFGVVAFVCVALLLAMSLIAPLAVAREFERLIWLRGDPGTARNTERGSLSFVSTAPIQPAIRELGVRVVPPSYSGLTAVEFSGDQPIRALAGSRIELVLETAGPVEGASFSFGGLGQPMRDSGGGDFAGTFVADKSGALEVRLSSEAVTPVVRTVEVYPDATPEVRLTEPAADQLWKTLPARPITLRWTAKDDLGLANVTLKYIKSRGNGDSATFVNGELPGGSVQRGNSNEWSGGTAIDLRRLQMEPGDTLVVWAEARDQRPGTDTVGRSGSIALALTAPELAKINLDGLGPTELGKFLLSERMILQHTERLHRERPRMLAHDITRRANDIAGEQRDFRSSLGGFTTSEGMASGGQLELNAMGGPPSPGVIDQQVQDLVAERNEIHRHGIPDAPQGASDKVRDLVLALRAMGDAEDALADTNTIKALEFIRTALTRLKSAQAAERYIPPINATSRPIDLKRRYSGELADVKTRLETFGRQPETAGTKDLRAALTEAYAALSELANQSQPPAGDRGAAVSRAREHVHLAAERLSSVTGEHAVAVGTALGQLRIVEGALTNANSSRGSADFASATATPFKLLLQATAGLFDLVDTRLRSAVGSPAWASPTRDVRSGEYFRLLRSRP
jgi:hypothetical protein